MVKDREGKPLGTWGGHETLEKTEILKLQTQGFRDLGRCPGTGGGRAGEKDPVRGSCRDSEKRLRTAQPRRPVPLTDRRFRKWHAKSPGL